MLDSSYQQIMIWRTHGIVEYWNNGIMFRNTQLQLLNWIESCPPNPDLFAFFEEIQST
jgi:hypothetical protein